MWPRRALALLIFKTGRRVHHEPNTLALLISLICAGASADALGKAAETTADCVTNYATEHATEHATERAAERAAEKYLLSQEVCVVRRKLETPNAWPLILNGIRDAEAGSLGLSLSVATHHDLPQSRRELDERVVDAADENTLLSAVALKYEHELELQLEPEDLLERVNAAGQFGSSLAQTAASPRAATVLFRSAPAQPATARQALLESETPAERPQALALALPTEPLAAQRGDIAIPASAQRVMRDLAVIRVAALGVDPNEAVAATAAAPLTALTALTALTPSATVLANLSDVLIAPDVTHQVTHTVEAADASASLKAEIAARQEAKRMKRRARAEAAAFAQADQAAQAAQAAQANQADQTAPATRANPFGGRRVAVLDHALDRVRGGFVTSNLNIAFGIERAVYINGALVTTTSLNISDVGRVTTNTNTNIGAGAESKPVSPSTLALIQSGAGNSVAGGAFSVGAAAGASMGLSANAIGTVVQNTLDGQKIQNVTVINATANSLGVLRGLNLQNALRSSLIDSLRR